MESKFKATGMIAVLAIAAIFYAAYEVRPRTIPEAVRDAIGMRLVESDLRTFYKERAASIHDLNRPCAGIIEKWGGYFSCSPYIATTSAGTEKDRVLHGVYISTYANKEAADTVWNLRHFVAQYPVDHKSYYAAMILSSDPEYKRLAGALAEPIATKDVALAEFTVRSH